MRDFSDFKAGDAVCVKVNTRDSSKYHPFTSGKIYLATVARDGWSANVIGDDNLTHCILFSGCAHLRGGDWEVLPEKVGKYYDRFGQLPPKELEELCTS